MELYHGFAASEVHAYVTLRETNTRMCTQTLGLGVGEALCCAALPDVGHTDTAPHCAWLSTAQPMSTAQGSWPPHHPTAGQPIIRHSLAVTLLALFGSQWESRFPFCTVLSSEAKRCQRLR